MAMDATQVISGNFGKIFHEGSWMTNLTSLELSAEINKEEVNRSGTRSVGHKTTSITYTGTISGYRVTPQLAKQIAQIADDTKGAFVTEIIAKLDDPESAPEGKTRVRIKGVQFDNIPIMNFEVGSIVEEEYNFTATGFEYID